MTIETLCCMRIVGPARFYCAADGCQTFLTDDTQAFCAEHNSQWPEPPIRNGLTKDFWMNLIRNARAHERTAQQTVSSTVPAGHLQQSQAGATDGFGQPFDLSRVFKPDVYPDSQVDQPDSQVDQLELQKLRVVRDAVVVFLNRSETPWRCSVTPSNADVV